MTRFGGQYEIGFYKNLNNGSNAKHKDICKKIKDITLTKEPKFKIKKLLSVINYFLISKLRISRKQSPIQETKVPLNHYDLNILQRTYNIGSKFFENENFAKLLITKRCFNQKSDNNLIISIN